MVETKSGPPSGERSALVNNVQRLLKRDYVDEVEVERVRSHALQRLAAMTDPEARRDAEAAPPDADQGDGSTRDVVADEADGVRVEGAVDVIDVQDTSAQAVEAEPTPDQPSGRRESEAVAEAEAMAEAMADSEALEANQPPVDASPAALEPDATDVEVAVARPDGDAGTAEAEAPTQVALFGSDEAPSEAPTAVAETTETTDATVASPVAVASPAYCPYCATILEPPPTADRRCGQCRQKIVVRHVGTRTVLLAEAALPVFEAERRRAAEAERWGRLRDKWLELARWAGAPADKVARLAAEPPAEAKAIAARTLYNAAVDRSFEAAMRTGKLEQAGRIRFDQAAVLFGFAGSAVPPPPTDPGSGKTATDRPGRRSAPSRSTRRGG